MEIAVANRLIEINRRFYTGFGRSFSATRGRLQLGVLRILERMCRNERILDLGCGNGELVRALARCGHRGEYLGLDFSQPLLDEARRAPPECFQAAFLKIDLTIPDWDKRIRETVPCSPFTDQFDVVLAFAVLHHIPGAELRLNILREAHSLLCSGGRFIHSEWQFLNSQRLHAHIQPWEAVGLSASDVDEGDYLLDWRRGGRGLRYVHHFAEAELNHLALVSRFEVRRTFHSDGEGGRLGLYQIWEKK